MNKKLPIACIILGVVLVIIAVCLPSGSDRNGFIGIVKMMPQDMEELTYIDAGALQNDESLASIWSSIQRKLIGEEVFGEDVEKLTGFGLFGAESDVVIYEGDFDLDQMTSVIQGNTTESFEYDGHTIWTDQYLSSTTIIDDVVFVGSTEDIKLCINVSNGKGASLYGDNDVRDIVGRLPGGYMHRVMVAGEGSSAGEYGIVAIGMAESKQGGNISQKSVLKFGDSDDAQAYRELIEEEVVTEGYDIVQDGRYLIVSSISEIPGPEEAAYNAAYDAIQSAVVQFYYSYGGSLPTTNGTVNVSGYESQIIDICKLLVFTTLGKAPEGLVSIDGSDNDNCDVGCGGCSPDNHYIWAVNDYGIFSVCVGDECEANGEDGYQGVWP